ncbi:polysaccharide biosynthesis/export family protein [Sphingopyxis sp.]|uniref:polysaccharide biosynthesis/export family protein n=1 Tax=Sphingopyxis sp. TaxID=1908224 RepID=UPI003F70D8DE
MPLRILAIITLTLLGACSTGPKLGAPGSAVQVTDYQLLPAPNATDMVRPQSTYLVGPFDKLSVKVYPGDELSRDEAQVDGEGRLSFPLAGVIDVGGKSPREIEDLIAERLRGRYIRDPQVTVNLKETRTQVVTIDGEVQQPGPYPVMGDMSLMRTVAAAKGLTEDAKLEDVVIFRTVNGQKLAALYNLRAIRRGVVADPQIYANDVVVVGESRARQLFEQLLGVASTISYPLIAIVQN